MLAATIVAVTVCCARMHVCASNTGSLVQATASVTQMQLFSSKAHSLCRVSLEQPPARMHALGSAASCRAGGGDLITVVLHPCMWLICVLWPAYCTGFLYCTFVMNSAGANAVTTVLIGLECPLH